MERLESGDDYDRKIRQNISAARFFRARDFGDDAAAA